jgi:hypothetical protein
MIIGIIVSVIAKLMKPHAINIFCGPERCIQGVMANGIPMLIALRRNATPVNASPVICLVVESLVDHVGAYLEVHSTFPGV